MWNKLEHAYKLQIDAQENPLELCYIPEVFRKHHYDKLFITHETTKKVQNNIHLNNYKYIVKPQCIKNSVGETMIDFFNFTNFLVTTIAQERVNQYYNHLIDPKYSDHCSSQFTNNLIENFGYYTDSSNEPYVTANTASTHCLEHQKCVRELIQGLQPLSDAVNNYFDVTYPVLYAKMKKLDLGPNVPKSFGAFPTVSINFNCISQFHRDLKDHHNTLCVVYPLGIFKGAHLVFPELKLAQKRKFKSLFSNGDLDPSEILDTTLSTKKSKKNNPSLNPRNFLDLKNNRRNYLNMKLPLKGFPAKYRSED
ncbi:hypothetical protein Glove_165g92 [Diversispora epigaea]|uniref:Uncharacterized protein n=1 Tax=Diversispora epigaea TaxID=1348612 RepID=A0A397IQU7_9GLOM|nr:hypothetical protein Glove_165g92 [Diversispora epigaea]